MHNDHTGAPVLRAEDFPPVPFAITSGQIERAVSALELIAQALIKIAHPPAPEAWKGGGTIQNVAVRAGFPTIAELDRFRNGEDAADIWPGVYVPRQI